MNRFRKWVVGLHGGQLVILLALQTLGGVVTFAGSVFVADIVEDHYLQEASLAKQYQQEKMLVALKKHFDVAGAKKAGYSDAEIDNYLLSGGAADADPMGEDLQPSADIDPDFSRLAAEAGISDSEPAADSARIAKAYQASTVFPNSLMIVGVALLLSMWTWALLSLWWWLGSRKKPEGAQ
jgi:hypothetical protein